MRIRYWPGAIVAATLLAACARPAPPGPTAAPAGTPTVQRAALAGGFVTVTITLPPGRSGPRPAIISPATDREALTAAGFILVDYRVHWEQLAPLRPPAEAPPAGGHTVGRWLLASPSAATVGRAYFELIDYDAAHAIPMVLDHLATRPEVDATRIGITGNSTRGFTALQAMANDARLATGAVANACGDYHTFLARSTLGLDGAEPLALAPDYAAWLAAREPIRHADRFPPAPLLLVNGDRDRAIPIDCARRTAHAFAAAYEAAGVPQRFRAVVLPGHAHELGPDVEAEVRAWLVRWLAP